MLRRDLFDVAEERLAPLKLKQGRGVSSESDSNSSLGVTFLFL
jgi:hypothetical protein